MRISPVSSNNNTAFNGFISKRLEKMAAVLPEKTKPNRRSIPIEYHNALVKLTAWRVFFLTATIFGVAGYKVTDNYADKQAEKFSDAVSIADIDKEAPIELKDLTNDGNKELILKKKDGSNLVLDLVNLEVLTERTGLE